MLEVNNTIRKNYIIDDIVDENDYVFWLSISNLVMRSLLFVTLIGILPYDQYNRRKK